MIDQITEKLAASKTIEENDKELYSYGLRQGMILLTQTASILLIGIILGMWWQSILFMVAYVPLRLSAGGIHVNKQWVCFIFTLLHFTALMLLVRFIDWSYLAIIIITVISGVIIFLIAPVEDKNKPFDDVEKRVFTKRTRIVLIIEIFVITLMVILGLKQIAECIFITVGTLAIMIVLGKLKNLSYEKHIRMQ